MKNKSLHELNIELKAKYKTKNNTYAMFPVGTKVKVICCCQDMTLFKNEPIAEVIKNSESYLGIRIKFEDGWEFGFEPSDLVVFEPMHSNGEQQPTQINWNQVLPEQLFEYLERCGLKPTDFQKEVIRQMLGNGLDRKASHSHLIEELKKIREEIPEPYDEHSYTYLEGKVDMVDQIITLLQARKD